MDTDSALITSLQRQNSLKNSGKKKCYYKSQQLNKLQYITFPVPGAAVLNTNYTKYNVGQRARLRHPKSQCKYVITIAMHRLELITLFYIKW